MKQRPFDLPRKSRDGRNIQFQLSQEDKQCNYEMRLLVQGRDRVLMIIRNLGDEQALETPRGGRNNSDTLTGLTARDVFRTDFDSLIADAKLRERGVAVFCIDIDRFTRINETMGRAVGDTVLQVTAKRIERCLRSSDQLARIDDTDSSSLTRISGDELCRAVKADPGKLAEDGYIQAIQSVEDAAESVG